MIDRRDFIKTGLIAGTGLSALPLLAAKGKSNPGKPSLIKPKMLLPGQTVGIVAPAGALFEDEKMESITEALKLLGLEVKFSAEILSKKGYLAGEDAARVKSLHDMFLDPSVNAIMAMRGGFGCNRILELIDYSLIRKNPKIFVGFSDITALLLAIHHKTGLVTFHGPMGSSTWSPFTAKSFFNALMQKNPFRLENFEENDPVVVFKEGKLKGEIVGGNLIVFNTLIGSSFMPNLDNKILFLEEVSEEVYRIDRLLSHLKLSGTLAKLKAVFFGVCRKCEAEDPAKSLELLEVIEYYFKPLGIPAWYGSSIGHINDKVTVPIGMEAHIDASKGLVWFTEGAVE